MAVLLQPVGDVVAGEDRAGGVEVEAEGCTGLVGDGGAQLSGGEVERRSLDVYELAALGGAR